MRSDEEEAWWSVWPNTLVRVVEEEVGECKGGQGARVPEATCALACPDTPYGQIVSILVSTYFKLAMLTSGPALAFLSLGRTRPNLYDWLTGGLGLMCSSKQVVQHTEEPPLQLASGYVVCPLI